MKIIVAAYLALSLTIAIILAGLWLVGESVEHFLPVDDPVADHVRKNFQ